MNKILLHPSTMSASRLAIIFGMLIVFFAMLSTTTHLQRPNNGDGWRILRSAQIVAPPTYYKNQTFPRFFELKDLHAIKPIDLVPMSSSAAVVEVISFIERAANFKQFDFMGVTAFYLALYLFGILLILLNVRLFIAVPLLLILVNPYILAYFNSPYEESLVISLCPLLSFLFIKEAQSSKLASRTIALVIASTKVQFVPAFLFGIKDLKLRHNVLYLLLSIVVIGAVVMKAGKFNEPNSYNRFFNGLAYSMSGVSAWPAHEFNARRAIAGELTVQNGVTLPDDAPQVKKYWGTSFWPTGDKLAASEQEFILNHVKKWYWQTVLANPQSYYRLLTEPIVTMVKADYRMNYIFETGMDNSWINVHAFIMKNFGMIFLLASVCSGIIAVRTRNVRHVLFVAFSLLYPLLVVYGDGYYEFEKHLFPMLFLGVVFFLALASMRLFAERPEEVRPQGLSQFPGGHSQENAV